MAATPRDRSEVHVDLAALARNFRRLQEAAPHAECCGVVKANAYGLGLKPVAQRLWAEGCRRFFVAQLDEAAELRRYVPAIARVAVLNGLACTNPAAFREVDAVPVLNHLGDIDAWAAHARAAETRLPAIVHLDTGMNRLGLSPEEAEALIDTAGERLAPLALEAVMSHLACGGRPDHPMNAAQQRRFSSLVKRLPTMPTSLGNSAGVLMGPDFQGNLVRPGIATYGGNPCPDGPQALAPNPMEPVVAVDAPVLQVRHCESPMTIGYDAGYEVPRPARIATLAMGYGDGYLRSVYSFGPAFVAAGGARAPVVGKVSMDLITVDVTDLPGRPVEVGDSLELLGQTITINDVAEAAGTNPYEILTSLGHRPRWHYYCAAPAPEG